MADEEITGFQDVGAETANRDVRGGNNNLHQARQAKKDEFYTQYSDIQNEVNAYIEYNPDVFRNKTILLPCDDPEWSNFTKFFAQNFERYGIKKLISTSYAIESKNLPDDYDYQPTLFETKDPRFDIDRTRIKGKIFTLEKDSDNSGRIDINDLKWDYLEGDGDFRSDEVKKLRDEADFIVTNPPFSLFKEFLAWIVEADKKFLIIGNQNAITYKEVFPLIMNNETWLGPSIHSGDREFRVPSTYPLNAASCREDEHGNRFIRVKGVRWFTNIDHGRRHKPLSLMPMSDNIRYSKHKEVKGQEYQKYDNYEAIEVPFTDAIPSDYDGIMGVPITFLDKYCPEQFEILGATQRGCHDLVPDIKKYDDYWEMRQDGSPTGSSGSKTNENANLLQNDGKKNYFINAEGRIVQSAYQRLFIRRKE